MASAITNTTASTLNTSASSAGSSEVTSKEAADRFLKLLVAQMKNQDPLNPMDNAQVTSQMAQISTVTGIEKLNTTVNGLTGQFNQMQAVQGAALVGRSVLYEGSSTLVEGGKLSAGFDLAGPADSVSVDVMNSAGRVVDTLQLGAASAGRQGFEWNSNGLADGEKVSFKITAKSGAGAVSATPLVSDTVSAVSTDPKGLVLELSKGGTLNYSAVKALS